MYIAIYLACYLSVCIAAAVSFIQLPYLVTENDGQAQTLLILSSEVSFAITLTVISSDGVATGE